MAERARFLYRWRDMQVSAGELHGGCVQKLEMDLP
jgi:hypothetical protein